MGNITSSTLHDLHNTVQCIGHPLLIENLGTGELKSKVQDNFKSFIRTGVRANN